MRNLSFPVIGLGVLAACAGSAQGAFFSFASDNDHTGWTFTGARSAEGVNGYDKIMDGNDPSRPFTLLIDDNNGPMPAVSLQAEFRANFQLTHNMSMNLGGSVWQHTYWVTGSFGFHDPNTGAALLTCDIGTSAPAVFTTPGGQNTWSSTGAALGSDGFADITYTIHQGLIDRLGAATAAQLGFLFAGPSGGPDDFGFDFSFINVNNAVGAQLDPMSHFPISQTAGGGNVPAWRSESSYSGSSGVVVPAPGSLALLGLAGLTVFRRRHR